jgi:hypothetical protein
VPNFYHVSPNDFVIAWEAASSVRELALKLGMSPRAVAARANFYRRRGVRLKRLKLQTSRRLNVEELNRVILAQRQVRA